MATALILLHPFPLDGTFWAPLAARLAGDRAVHMPEFPGFGGAPPAEGPSIAGVADTLSSRIESQCSDGRAVVCGVSMGGYIALALAARAPERVAGLILCGTRAGADGEEARRARLEAAEQLERGERDAFLGGLLPRLVAEGNGQARAVASTIAYRQDAAALAAAQRAMAARPDRSDELASMRVPAAVMWGEHDGLIGADEAWALAERLPQGELSVVSGAGHLIPLERPEHFMAQAGDLLARVDAVERERRVD